MSNCLFPIETHLICDFPEGVRTPFPPLWIPTWCSTYSFMVKATIHYLIWAWKTLIDRRMYHPFIFIYLIISVYYRNLRYFNRWQLYILFNNVSYFGWSLTNHWPRALFPRKHDCRGLNCHFNLLTDILCELRYRRLCFIEKWPKCSIIIRYATLLHWIGDNREGSEQSMNSDHKSLEFSICRQSVKQTAIQSLFLTVLYDLRLSIATTFLIATYLVCVLIQWICNQNNLKTRARSHLHFSVMFLLKKKIGFHTG